MRDEFLIFGSPLIGRDEIDEVIATLESGWIGTGPRVARFERDFAAYKGMEHVVAVNSCTAALHLSLLVAGVGPGDEVITTPLTFCATINAIVHCGAIPVLVDVNPNTMNIEPSLIEASITPRTKAILPVHFAGRPCAMDEISAIAGARGLEIIEDCAHSIESEYHDRKTGTFGRFGCFSFYVTKNVITGEGGMILCRDKEDADRVRTLALHGMSCDAWKRFSDSGYKHYFVVAPGFKYNMMDIQAAIGLHQLARVEENHRRRAEIWARYSSALADLPLTLPRPPEPNTRHAYHLYTVLLNHDALVTRDEFLEQMTKHRIGVGVHYLSIPEHPYYQAAFQWKPEMWPNAMEIGRRTVSLPISAKLTDEDVDGVVAASRAILGG